MVKKIMTLVMSLGLFCGAVSAQIAPEDIQFWVGNGDGEAVVTVIWSTPDTGLAWGVRYDTEDGLDPISALAAIAAGDSRFTYTVDYQGFVVAGIAPSITTTVRRASALPPKNIPVSMWMS